MHTHHKNTAYIEQEILIWRVTLFLHNMSQTNVCHKQMQNYISVQTDAAAFPAKDYAECACSAIKAASRSSITV